MHKMLKNIENQSSALTTGNKRNADSMLQQYGGSPMISPSNETVASDAQSDTENYALKRPRVTNDLQQTNGAHLEKISPSKVIHVRNLPPDTSETEVMALACSHGSVTNLILMRNKRQAFVEMLEISQAIAFIRYHQNPMCPALIRGHAVQLQYSATYTELKPGQRSHANGMKPTPVLHVNVDNLLVPVTLHILHQIFSRHGPVEKIITFTKNSQFQSLIQMSDVNCAQAAKQELDGKSIYANCCVLRIDFSKMISVNVKYNNDKSRDFTNPDLPSGDETSPGPPPMALPPTHLQLAASQAQLPPHMMGHVRPLGIALPFASAVNPSQVVNPMSGVPGVTGVPGVPGYQLMPGITPAMLQGFGLQAPGLPTAPLGAPQIPSTSAPTQSLAPRPLQLSPARLPMPHLSLSDTQLSSGSMNPLQLLMSQLPSLPPASQLHMSQPRMPHFPMTPQLQAHQMLLGQSALNQVATSSANRLHESQLLARQVHLQQPITTEHQLSHSVPPTLAPLNTSPDLGAPTLSPQSSTSPVVLVSNLNSKKVSPDALFTLFGMYGDVMRVKILYHKLDTAMVQYEDNSMALMACKYLDRAVFWENEIRVMLSKHHNIQMPSTESHKEGFKLTKDYTSSDLHRYHKRGSRNMANIYAPSSTLHLSNIPADIIDESVIVNEFSKYGSITGFKFFHNDKRMALIQMSSEPEAIAALIEMHNFPISNTHNLRVSFSKSPIHG